MKRRIQRMKCEACGGDGLVEIGAYRGDESDVNTRQCQLCGGVVTTTPAETVGATLDRMAQVGYPDITSIAEAKSVGVQLSSIRERHLAKARLERQNTNRVRRLIEKKPHTHAWNLEVKVRWSDRRYVECSCSCKTKLEFDTGGNLTKGSIPESELDALAHQARIAWLAYKQRCREENARSN